MSVPDLIAPAVILNEPQLAENIGAVARAMANFGLSDLRMVRPRDGWPQERAWASASGADWPLEGARVFQSLDEAMGELQVVFATTARPRELRLPILTPRQAAAELHASSSAGQKVGLLYGGERAGLETQDIALCQGVITIPIDPKFRSLNLAQSVAVTAYEWRMAVLDRPPPAFRDQAEPASQAGLTGLYGQLEAELHTAGFFHPPEKTPGMVNNLRAIFARARLSEQEVRTLRGVVTALSKGRGKVLEKLAAKKARGETWTICPGPTLQTTVMAGLVPAIHPAQSLAMGTRDLFNRFIAVYMMNNHKRGTLYIGVTSELPSRAAQHREGAIPGFTQRYSLKRLVWFEEHETMASAIQREKSLKKYKREWKIKLIEYENRNWEDLFPSLFAPSADCGWPGQARP